MVDREVVEELAARFAAASSAFDAPSFIAAVTTELPGLELKERIALIARRIAAALPADYPTALGAVVAVAEAEPPIGGFAAWPLCAFVELFGLEDPVASLAAMEHLTKRASCEFAIRPLLRDHWDLAYRTLCHFTAHEDENVRRLASEGTRPRLPWATRVPRLVENPRPGIALVTRLRHDPSETVRRSVANHLNDVGRRHADLVVETGRSWLAEDPPADRKMVAHALRTLVKQGHPGALEVLGYTTEAHIAVLEFGVDPPRVEMGDRIVLTATLRSTAAVAQRLVIDFIIHHVTATGGASPKVFKWATIDLAAGATVTLTKRRQIVHASTRTYHAGPHTVELQVAGERLAAGSFDVTL